MRILASIDRWVARGELVLAIAAMTALVLILIAQVFFRYVLGTPLFFAEEVALLLLIVATFAGLSLLVAERRMVAVDLVGQALSGPAHRVVVWCVGVLALLVLLTLTWHAVGYLLVPWVWIERSATVNVPRATIYAIVTAELAFTCLHQAVMLIQTFPARRSAV